MHTPLLLEAQETISAKRQKEYGDPKVALRQVAEQWALYIQQKYGAVLFLNAEDVCWMMADLKKTRQMIRRKRDNVVDAAGYMGLIEKVE